MEVSACIWFRLTEVSIRGQECPRGQGVDSASVGTQRHELLKGHGFAAVVDPFQQVLIVLKAQGEEVLHGLFADVISIGCLGASAPKLGPVRQASYEFDHTSNGRDQYRFLPECGFVAVSDLLKLFSHHLYIRGGDVHIKNLGHLLLTLPETYAIDDSTEL